MSVPPHSGDLLVRVVSHVIHLQLVGEVTTIHRVDVPVKGYILYS